MGITASFFTWCILILISAGCTIDPAPSLASQLAPGVWGVLVSPDDDEIYSGVILLHGSKGWRPELIDLARAISGYGFVVLTIDYYKETGFTTSGSTAKLKAWPGYQDAVRKSVEYLQSLPSVSGQPVGLIGFSRGAFLAISVASSLPAVRAVVSFYGGGSASLEEDVQGLPPVLILHGDADIVVPVGFAYGLRDAVIAAGGEAELHVYQGAGHSFNAPFLPSYSEEIANDAHMRTIEFLLNHLVTQ